jgi:uncharacterized membrane protein YqjE
MATVHERPFADRPPADSRSVGELLRDLANDVTGLIRNELALARTEAQEKLHQMVTAAVALVAGALVAFAALIILLQALVIALAKVMPDWLAAVVVGVVVAAIGLILVWRGMANLSAQRLAPERTAANLRRDVHLVQEKVS